MEFPWGMPQFLSRRWRVYGGESYEKDLKWMIESYEMDDFKMEGLWTILK